MENFIIDIMNNYGYIGICLLILRENVFPPIPSELILTFGGFMTQNSNITIIGVIIAATIGSLLGAIILYYIGKILNKERLIKIVTSKYGKWLRIKPKDIEAADKWFDEKGNKTVFFCRFIPVIRSLISIPAGMSEMPMGKFLVYTITGSAIWNTVLIVVGSIVGENWTNILGILDNYSHIVLILLIIAFVVFVFWFYRSKMKKKDKTEEIKELPENIEESKTVSSNLNEKEDIEAQPKTKTDSNKKIKKRNKFKK